MMKARAAERERDRETERTENTQSLKQKHTVSVLSHNSHRRNEKLDHINFDILLMNFLTECDTFSWLRPLLLLCLCIVRTVAICICVLRSSFLRFSLCLSSLLLSTDNLEFRFVFPNICIINFIERPLIFRSFLCFVGIFFRAMFHRCEMK